MHYLAETPFGPELRFFLLTSRLLKNSSSTVWVGGNPFFWAFGNAKRPSWGWGRGQGSVPPGPSPDSTFSTTF